LAFVFAAAAEKVTTKTIAIALVVGKKYQKWMYKCTQKQYQVV